MPPSNDGVVPGLMLLSHRKVVPAVRDIVATNNPGIKRSDQSATKRVAASA